MKNRLYSLDILRGADIFFLTVLSAIFYAIDKVWALPEGFMAQLDHPAWTGFSVLDMVMPLFIFMCGAALPLALPKRLDADGHAGWPYWRHVLARVAMLWVFGMIAQGELLSFDLRRISFFNNTLQTIACGYVAVAFVVLIRRKWIQVLIPLLLAALYTVFLHTCGDLTPRGNAAVVYEVKFLSLFYPDATWHPVKQIADWHYTWWTTIPMFAFMGLAGYHATTILQTAWKPWRRAGVMAGVGLALLGVGFVLLACGDPCIKHIFTASFTFLAMGVSFLLYALSYVLFDILGWRRGTGLVNLFGRHSLWAYMFRDTCLGAPFWTAATLLLGGTEKKFGFGLSRFFSSKDAYEFCHLLVVIPLVILSMKAWDVWKRKERNL